MWKKAVLIAAGSLVVVLIASAFLFGPKDEQLIQEALDESIRASRTGSPGGVVEHMSRNMTFGGDMPVNKGDVARIVRFMKPEVDVLDRETNIQGSTATITSPVNLTFNSGEDKGTTKVQSVVITFTRETGLRWGIVPYPKWRIRDIKADGFDPSIFTTGIL